MTARTLVLHHAGLLREVASLRETAERRRMVGDTERAEMALDEAAEKLNVANALRDVLSRFDDVHVPDSRQLSLLSIPEE